MLNEEKLARRAPSGSRQRAIDVLYARGEHRFRMQLGALGRVLQLLGRPERRFPSILIGGTNGKGSVSAICDSIARAAGRRTGFYSSPHLVSVGERVRIEGRAADDDQLSGWLEVVLEAEEQVCRRVADSEL
ncbi:MAG: hypothetical protein KC609_09285, partial [Myxococcales bacterium]|nr:hypothetical protein [Myxococcales bacterium]